MYEHLTALVNEIFGSWLDFPPGVCLSYDADSALSEVPLDIKYIDFLHIICEIGPGNPRHRLANTGYLSVLHSDTIGEYF